MIIHDTSIRNISEQLQPFLTTMQACDYIVYGSLIEFQYEGDSGLFDRSLIKKIYDKFGEETDGKITMSEWVLSFEDITAKLKFTAPGKGDSHDDESGLDVVSMGEHEKRKKFFWDLIKNKITFPPEKVYHYEDYFSSDVMWGCSYIFLKDGQGLLLHLGVSD